MKDIEKLIKISQKKSCKGTYVPGSFDIHVGKGIPIDISVNRSVEVENLFIKEETRKHHVGCIGTTGSGKTRLMMYMVTQDILAGNSVLVIDPKYDADLLGRIIEAAAVVGRLNEIIYFNPIVPSISNKLNLLYSYYIPDELIDHVVAGIRAKEEYFENVAYEVTTAIVLGLYALAKARGERLVLNFYEIKRWCDHRALGELYDSLEHLVYSTDLEIKQIATDVRLFIEQIRSSPADFFSKVSSSLRAVLTSISASNVGELVGKAIKNEFIESLEKGKRVIVYCNTGVLVMRKASHVLGRIIMSMIQSLIGRFLANKKKLNPPLVIYLDEGHNVLYRGIEELFAKGRAANVWVNFFTQSISSVTGILGEELGNVIMDNISTWIFMRVNAKETAEYVASIFPDVITLKKRYIPGSEGASIILSEEEDYIFDYHKIMSLQVGRFLLKTADGKHYIGEVPHVPDTKIKVKFPFDEIAPKLGEESVTENEKALH